MIGGIMHNHLPRLSILAAAMFGSSVAWSRAPESLLTNHGAIWAGDGPMILLSRTPSGEGVDCYALELGSTAPILIAEFDVATLWINRFLMLESDAPNQAVVFGYGHIFDITRENLIPAGQGREVYFSYDPLSQTFLQGADNPVTKTFEIHDVDTVTGERTLIYAIPLISFPSQLDINNVVDGVQLGPDLIAVEAREEGEFAFFQDIILVAISEGTPVLTYVREGGLPSSPEGIDSNILRFRDDFSSTEMTWMDVLTGEILRVVDVGARWVSHSVNKSTGAYYFHDVERVVEDPAGSGVYYTEIPVIVFEDDFTTRTEMAFRIAYPTEPPTPEDYVDHLLGRTEPLPGSPFPVRKRVSPAIFLNPDRNGDGTIDIADLVFRINELAAAPRTVPERPRPLS